MVLRLRTRLDKRVTVAPAFSITTSGQGDRRVIRLGGELDLASRAELADTCSAGSHADTIIDLGTLTFMDCGGYSSLMRIRQSAEANGRTVTIRNPVGQPALLMALVMDLRG
jgi:anti-anti-sigma factor